MPTPSDRFLITGRDLAAHVPVFSASGTPLAYVWPAGHSAEPYLGAAHGLIGILYALLVLQQHAPQCMPDAQRDLADIRAALGYRGACGNLLLEAVRAHASHVCWSLPVYQAKHGRWSGLWDGFMLLQLCVALRVFASGVPASSGGCHPNSGMSCGCSGLHISTSKHWHLRAQHTVR